MSDSDDEANLPPAAECERRCQEFASITCTDSALAMFYLQDKGWIVEQALEAYYADLPDDAVISRPPPAPPAVSSRSIEGAKAHASASSSECSASKMAGLAAVKRSCSSSDVITITDEPSAKIASNRSGDVPRSSPAASNFVDDQPRRVRVLSWNIDGLDQGNIVTRAKSVAKTILKERPDVVFLQEVVVKNLAVLNSDCPGYRVIVGSPSGTVGGEGNYVVAIMLRNDTVAYQDHDVVPFFSSEMARTLLTVEAKVKEIDCILMTSHLESTASHAAERKKQLKTAFGKMKEAGQSKTVIFGGDLNLRDKELSSIGGTPDNVVDIWEETGSRPEAKYTWDTQRNDNLEWAMAYKPRCRFDRLYCRTTDRLRPVYFELVGIERCEGCRRFPSDHWGILSHFDKK